MNSAALNALYRILNSSELARLGCAIQAKVASRLKDSRWGGTVWMQVNQGIRTDIAVTHNKDLEGFIENEVSYGIGRCGFVALVAFLIWVLRK